MGYVYYNFFFFQFLLILCKLNLVVSFFSRSLFIFFCLAASFSTRLEEKKNVFIYNYFVLLSIGYPHSHT